MEFKALSKKISSARLGAKVKCEFIKEGKVEYVDWCKNKQWRWCNLTNRFNFFVCPFRLKMTSKYIKIDQSSWSLMFLSRFLMYVFCDLTSHTAFHAGKMKLFQLSRMIFSVEKATVQIALPFGSAMFLRSCFVHSFCYFLSWTCVKICAFDSCKRSGFSGISACRFGFFGLPYLSFTIPSISGECFKHFATKEVQLTNV